MARYPDPAGDATARTQATIRDYGGEGVPLGFSLRPSEVAYLGE
jgi:hypothetical protein